MNDGRTFSIWNSFYCSHITRPASAGDFVGKSSIKNMVIDAGTFSGS